jgi:hypothetical protein
VSSHLPGAVSENGMRDFVSGLFDGIPGEFIFDVSILSLSQKEEEE